MAVFVFILLAGRLSCSDDGYPLDGITELRVRREMMRRPTLSVDQVSA